MLDQTDEVPHRQTVRLRLPKTTVPGVSAEVRFSAKDCTPASH